MPEAMVLGMVLVMLPLMRFEKGLRPAAEDLRKQLMGWLGVPQEMFVHMLQAVPWGGTAMCTARTEVIVGDENL